MANLNPDQFFHGTTAAIKDGVVRPVNDVPGKHVSEYSMGDPGDMSEGDHAFAIKNDENYAWHAAHTFHANGRRPRVYEVEPAADMKPGPYNKEHPDFLEHHELDNPDHYPTVGLDSDDYRAMVGMREAAEDARADHHQDEWGSPTGFKVKQRVDTMPGRQGTFPEVNWDRLKSSQAPHWAGSASHPDDEQVRYGMLGHPQGPAGDTPAATPKHLSSDQFHDWSKDPAPHSPLREAAGRPQKRWATLED